MVTQSKGDLHMHLVWIARRCNTGPRRRANLHVWPPQSCRELLPTASPLLLKDCTGSGRPIDIGAPLSNRPRRLGPYHMVGCQGRVVHTYWALMTNITACIKGWDLLRPVQGQAAGYSPAHPSHQDGSPGRRHLLGQAGRPHRPRCSPSTSP